MFADSLLKSESFFSFLSLSLSLSLALSPSLFFLINRVNRLFRVYDKRFYDPLCGRTIKIWDFWWQRHYLVLQSPYFHDIKCNLHAWKNWRGYELAIIICSLTMTAERLYQII